jgi:hypothetical protein
LMEKESFLSYLSGLNLCLDKLYECGMAVSSSVSNAVLTTCAPHRSTTHHP